MTTCWNPISDEIRIPSDRTKPKVGKGFSNGLLEAYEVHPLFPNDLSQLMLSAELAESTHILGEAFH